MKSTQMEIRMKAQFSTGRKALRVFEQWPENGMKMKTLKMIMRKMLVLYPNPTRSKSKKFQAEREIYPFLGNKIKSKDSSFEVCKGIINLKA